MAKLADSETYQAVLDYAKYKATTKWWKIFLLGIMGGAFIGLGYLGAFTMQGLGTKGDGVTDPVLQKFLFGAIFPAGIIACTFLGGTLFTSDSLASLPIMERQMKVMTAAKSWGVSLGGNFVGGFLMALIAVGANFYGGAHNRDVLLNFAEHKFGGEWYAALASGILCNIAVAGATWMASSTKSSIGKFFLIWLPIALFAMSGFQHIVANFFVFWSWLLDYYIHGSGAYNAANAVTGEHVGEWFYNNIIPTTIGNWLGGAVFVPLPYFLLNRGYGKNAAVDKAFAIATPIVPASFLKKANDETIVEENEDEESIEETVKSESKKAPSKKTATKQVVKKTTTVKKTTKPAIKKAV